jgi:hypothetical protein
MKCECKTECVEVEKCPFVSYQVWHCPLCDIDFYYLENGERVVMS